MALEDPETVQDAPAEPSVDTDDDKSTVIERLQFIETEHIRLSALFHEHLAEVKDIDRDFLTKAKDNDSEDWEESLDLDERLLSPKCEIARITSAELRAMQDRKAPQGKYSLLTVAPKGRREGNSNSRANGFPSAPGKAAVYKSSEPAEASILASSEKSYRVILNGRAELMEVLGGIFNSSTLPGLYVWLWPFKYLINYEKQVRLRLDEEEAKCNEIATPTIEEEEEEDEFRNDEFKKDVNSGHDEQIAVSSGIAQPSDVRFSDGNSQKAKEQEDVDPIDQLEIIQEKEAPTKTKDHETKSKASPTVNDTQYQDQPTERKEATNNDKHVAREREEKTERMGNTRLRDELRCLVEFMNHDMKDIFLVQQGLSDCTRHTIAFDYLWLLFRPGDMIVKKGDQMRAYIVLHVTGGRAMDRYTRTTGKEDISYEPYMSKEEQQEKEAYLAKFPRTSPFVIDCFYIDFDGSNFGPLPETFRLGEYDGEVHINSLEAYPVRFDKDARQTEMALKKRGKRFVRLARGDHKSYSGRTIRESPILETSGEVEGEIIIDFTLAIKNFQEQTKNFREPKWDLKFGTGVIGTPTAADERELTSYDGIVPIRRSRYLPTFFMGDAPYDRELRSDFLDNTTVLKERAYDEKLPSEALMLLPFRVYGFSLLDREWFAFDISRIEDIKQSEQGFESLVLPPGHKMIMQALVQHHTKGPASTNARPKKLYEDFSMDVIRGKGKGLIILLHGVPGVGKTSTAECVAAQTKRPLFPITCGDIGTTPSEVEERLTEYFDMAHKWGCVLLLDEADVFLAKREKGGDLQRNAIVSVFLRVLEYYSGILILTTNRIGEFDEAFSSRVHIKLYYPKLDRKSTLEIWKMNIHRITTSDLDITVDEKEIKKFARKLWTDSEDKQTQRWNGRQIRNAFQTAIALARWDHQEKFVDQDLNPRLSVRHFEIVAQTSAHFDNYISTMHGINEANDTWETIAARDFLRKSETPRKATSRMAATGARAKVRGSTQSSAKAETTDEEEEETDSDEIEKKVKSLQAELERRQKGKKPAGSGQRDRQAGQTQKVTLRAKEEEEKSSDDSDEGD